MPKKIEKPLKEKIKKTSNLKKVITWEDYLDNQTQKNFWWYAVLTIFSLFLSWMALLQENYLFIIVIICSFVLVLFIVNIPSRKAKIIFEKNYFLIDKTQFQLSRFSAFAFLKTDDKTNALILFYKKKWQPSFYLSLPDDKKLIEKELKEIFLENELQEINNFQESWIDKLYRLINF